MAEPAIDMAGKKGKQRKDSLRKGKSKKTDKETVSTDDQLTCHVCDTIFVDDEDKLLACERCDEWFCTKCVDMSDIVYKIMVERKDMHWYCSECEVQAVTAVKTDKDIEDKCAAYMKTVTDRLDNMEKKIDHKTDKETFDKLEDRVKSLENKDSDHNLSTPAEGEQKRADMVRETIEEQRDREFRVKNVIIHKLPESESDEMEAKIQDDTERVIELLTALDVTEDDPIERCSRIGDQEDDKVRMTKVTLKNVQLKRQILKKSRSLKDKEEYKEASHQDATD